MGKLIRSNFMRLWKSRVFWIAIIFMFGTGLQAVSSQYKRLSIPEYTVCGDDVLFTGCVYMAIVAAVFIGLFVGTEYSDGTIRNKLIVGHTRTAVYFSNLIVSTAALLMMHLAYIIVNIGLGFPLIGNIMLTPKKIIILTVISIIALTAFSAIYLFVSMLVHSKATASVVVMIMSIVLVMGALLIHSRLNEPEYYNGYHVTFVDETGEVFEESQERGKNYYYIDGTKRKIYEFLYDFLPSCQMYRLANQGEVSVSLPLYSVSIILVVTACGVVLFRKKDLN